MPEQSYNPFDPTQPDWRALVNDLQAQVEALSLGMENVRTAVNRLAQLDPWAVASAPPASRDAGQPTAAAASPEWEAAPEDPAWSAAYAEQQEEAWSTPADQQELDEEALRAEVRRSVEAARAELHGSPPEPAAPAPNGNGERGGLWAFMPQSPSLPSEEDETFAEKIWERDPAREDVRRAVEQARAEIETGYTNDSQDEEAGEGVREGLWPTARPSNDWTSQQLETPGGFEEEAGRADVRRTVDQARNGLGSFTDAGLRQELEDPVRDEVRRAVEQARSELEAQHGATPQPPSQPEDPDAARDEVRRAVEQARMEMAAGTLQTDASHTAPLREATPPDREPPPGRDPMERWHMPQPRDDTSGLPATIVIEDPDSRLDLAAVYSTLDNLDCAAYASLLNYAAHSVTVGLAGGIEAPSPEAIEAAVRAAFGRPCSVSTNGGRTSVQLGDGANARGVA